MNLRRRSSSFVMEFRNKMRQNEMRQQFAPQHSCRLTIVSCAPDRQLPVRKKAIVFGLFQASPCSAIQWPTRSPAPSAQPAPELILSRDHELHRVGPITKLVCRLIAIGLRPDISAGLMHDWPPVRCNARFLAPTPACSTAHARAVRRANAQRLPMQSRPQLGHCAHTPMVAANQEYVLLFSVACRRKWRAT